MGPNSAAVMRVFTRAIDATIADVTLPVDTPFEVVVEVKAGANIHKMGPVFFTNILIRDITANDNIAATQAAGFGGSMHTHAWLIEEQQFVYAVPAANLIGRGNHLCQVIAFLRVGVANPDVSFVVSPLFLLTN